MPAGWHEVKRQGTINGRSRIILCVYFPRHQKGAELTGISPPESQLIWRRCNSRIIQEFRRHTLRNIADIQPSKHLLTEQLRLPLVRLPVPCLFRENDPDGYEYHCVALTTIAILWRFRKLQEPLVIAPAALSEIILKLLVQI